MKNGSTRDWQMIVLWAVRYALGKENYIATGTIAYIRSYVKHFDVDVTMVMRSDIRGYLDHVRHLSPEHQKALEKVTGEWEKLDDALEERIKVMRERKK